ncbi:MAG: hypothetical protein P8Q50_13355 [Octadecabacter sp.]|nr:hypothetical protein [Octadecabacter sp.]
MVKTLSRRFLTAALLTIITSLWCWIITALHGAWSFGIVEGYLDGGRVPLYPTMPVIYGEFFFQALVSLLITFALAVIWCSFAPQPLRLIGVLVAWLIGFWAGAENISFTFQIDYGTTWAPFEALRALFIHSIVTPFALVMGVLGTYSLTRPFRT